MKHKRLHLPAWRALCGLTALTLGATPTFAQQPPMAEQVALNAAPKLPPSPTDKGAEAKPDSKSDRKAVELSAEELDEMRLTIKLLNDRVKELESRLNRPAGAVAAAPAVAGTPSASAAPAATSVRPAVQEKNGASDMGFTSLFRNTEISGFVDIYYGFNNNRPLNTSNPQDVVFGNFLRNFDNKHNQFALNLAKLAIESKVSADQRLGYRFDLAFGQTTEIVHNTEPASNPTPRSPGDPRTSDDPSLNFLRNIQQAYFSYLAPVGRGLQVDFGKFVTHTGYELIESKDNWNYSRSFIFALGPFYHFGAKATYPITDKLSFMAGLANGWNNVVDNNSRKTVISQVVYKPTSRVTLIQNYTGGPEEPINFIQGDFNPARGNQRWRNLFDTVAVVNVNSKLDLAANYIFGFDRFRDTSRAGNPERKVNWTAIAGYARFKPTERLAFSPRFEFFDDRDGAPFLTGTPQELKEFTMTGEYATKAGFTFRAEYRRDFSDQRVFSKPRGGPGNTPVMVDSQNTFTVGLIYAFSLKARQ
jgi:hypothetical protein